MYLIKHALRFLVSAKGIAVILFVIIYFFFSRMFSWLPSYHSRQEMMLNYDNKTDEILEVKRYFNTIVPPNKVVEIEFASRNKLERFGIYSSGKALHKDSAQMYFLDWNLDVTSKKVDSLIDILGWTRQTLRTLKQKLDQANCIQIESGEPTTIGFQRSGMGMLFYKVFDSPIPKSQIEMYNDSCTYIYYNPKVVLEYAGGAIGSQCFPRE